MHTVMETLHQRYSEAGSELCCKYDGFIRIYTDGSKSGNRVAAAVVAKKLC